MAKGKQLYNEGRFQARNWEDRDENQRTTTEVVATGMQMLGQVAGGGTRFQEKDESSSQGGTHQKRGYSLLRSEVLREKKGPH